MGLDSITHFAKTHPMMTPQQRKGAQAEAEAIRYFTKAGYAVSIPFAPLSYDLVIEKDSAFWGVQCKFTSRRRGLVYSVDFGSLDRCGGFDILFCFASNGDKFVTDAKTVAGHQFIELKAAWLVTDAYEEAPGLSCRRCRKPVPDPAFKTCPECRDYMTIHQREYRANQRTSKH